MTSIPPVSNREMISERNFISESDIDFWRQRNFSNEFIKRKLLEYNNDRITTAIFRIDGKRVSIIDKDPPTIFGDYIHRSNAYRELFERVINYFDINLSFMFPFELYDEGFDFPDIPAFAFQRTIGSTVLLLPDIDFMAYNHYYDYNDNILYHNKANKAIFVGSTTGAGQITQDKINKNEIPRVNSALYFRAFEDVYFDLPKITQVASDEIKAMLESMGFGSGNTVTWNEQLKNKFIISMDGNGATCSRVVIALKSNSVLLKYKSDHELFYFNKLIPYEHFIPINKDSDVLEIIAMEKNTPGKYKHISENASEFYNAYLSEEEILKYTGQMLLTYYELLYNSSGHAPLTLSIFSDRSDDHKHGSATKESERGEAIKNVLPDHKGMYYRDLLRKIHEGLQPNNYLEIGVETGATLAYANCPAIAVDPNFHISIDVIGTKKICMLFQMTSDEFFGKFNPKKLFSAPIDFSFLDGMHLAEFLLRDFLNVEKYSSHGSLIAIHDCLPVEFPMASRTPGEQATTPDRNGAWTGDVWKTIVALKRHRRDLKIRAYDSHSTGMILISDLSPDFVTTAELYGLMLETIQGLSLSTFGLENLYQFLEVRSTDQLFSDGRFIGIDAL